jgi:hypothetical protein
MNQELLGIHLAGTKNEIDLEAISESGRVSEAMQRCFDAVYQANLDDPNMSVTDAMKIITVELAKFTGELDDQ